MEQQIKKEEMCQQCKVGEVDNASGFKLCAKCALGKIGLPWMNQMVVRHTFPGEIGYATIGQKEYLIVSGSGGMLFTKDEAIKAEERFRGERALDK